MNRPVSLYLAYADADSPLRADLEQHLAPLQAQGRLNIWHRGQLEAGDRSDDKIKRQLFSAEIIVVLLSSDFLAEPQYKAIEEELVRRDVCLVPVKVRSCHLTVTAFATRQVLPRDGTALARNSDRAVQDEAWQEVVQSIDDLCRRLTPPPLPEDSAHGVADFLDEYLGNPRRPVPFAGRDAELHAVRSWLADDRGQPYLMLIAPPGIGKSALLAEVYKNVKQDGSSVVICPISLRFGTHHEDVVLRQLVVGLTAWHGRVGSDRHSSSTVRLREQFSQLLQTSHPSGPSQRVLIIDGLDEATDWSSVPGFFPRRPAPGTRVVLSMREGAGSASVAGWRQRLGLDHDDLSRVMSLGPLTLDGVRSVAAASGHAASESTSESLTTELFRLTEGDPVMLRLYLKALHKAADESPPIPLWDLATIRPGLEAYFERWWTEQQRQWGDNRPSLNPLIEAVLGLLSRARGPLHREELASLLPPDLRVSSFALDETMRRLDRWIIGDGRSRRYAFGHPRLATFFSDRLLDQERACWDQRFLDFGAEALSRLQEGHTGLEHGYLLQHYGLHIEASKNSTRDLLRLVSDPWRSAWLAFSGDAAGFLVDVQRAWRAAEREDQRAIAAGVPAEHLADEVRCALCVASVSSLADRIPPSLLSALFEKGVWSLDRVREHARRISDEEKRSGALLELAKKAAPEQLEGLLHEALTAARRIPSASIRAAQLVDIFNVLPASMHALREDILREEVTSNQDRSDGEAQVFASFMPYLPMEERDVAAKEIGARLESILTPQDKLFTLAHMVPHLSETSQARWTGEILQLSNKLVPSVRVALAGILPALFDESQQNIAYKIAQSIKPATERALAFCHLATSQHCPEVLRITAYEQTLAALRLFVADPEENFPPSPQLGDFSMLPQPFQELLGQRFSKTVCHALHTAGVIKVLLHLAWNAPPERLEQVRALVQSATFYMPQRPWLLMILAVRSPQPDFYALLSELASLDVDDRYHPLSILAPYLPAALLTEALALCTTIRDQAARLRCLTNMARMGLPDGQVKRIIAIAKEISYPEGRAEALRDLLSALPLRQRTLVERDAVQAAQVLDELVRAEALNSLLPNLQELRDEVVRSIGAILRVKKAPARLVASLGSYLPARDPTMDALIKHSLRSIEKDKEPWEQSATLAELAPYLYDVHREQARAIALNAPNPGRAEMLTRLLGNAAPDELEIRAVEALDAIEECPVPDRLTPLKNLAAKLPSSLFQRARRIALSLELKRDGKNAVPTLRISALLAILEHSPPSQSKRIVIDILKCGRDCRSFADYLSLIPVIPHLWDEQTRGRLIRRIISSLFSEKTSFFDKMSYYGLGTLAPHLSSAQHEQVLGKLPESSYWSESEIHNLVPHLPANLLYKVIDKVSDLRYDYLRRTLLGALVARIGDLPARDFSSLLRSIFHRGEYVARSVILDELGISSPLLVALGTPSVISTIVDSIIEVGTWWP